MKILKNCRSGFTLIEVVMTIMILMIILIPFSSLFTQGMITYRDSGTITSAVNLAQAKMESLKETQLTTLPTDWPVEWTPFIEDAKFKYKVKRDTGTDVSGLIMYQIDVKVQYTYAGQVKEMAINTLMSEMSD